MNQSLNQSQNLEGNFESLFNNQIAKRRHGVARCVALHLFGCLQMQRRQTPSQTDFYVVFDELMQTAIQFFSDFEDPENTWNSPVIAWALGELEKAEQLATRGNQHFVGALQKGKYASVTYYMKKAEPNKAFQKAAEYLDDYAVQLLYPLKKVVKKPFKEKYTKEAKLEQRSRSWI